MDPPNPPKGGSPPDNPARVAYLKAMARQKQHNEVVKLFQEGLDAKPRLHNSRYVKRAIREVNSGNQNVIKAISDTFYNNQKLGSTFFKQQM